VNKLNKQQRTADEGWSSSLGGSCKRNRDILLGTWNVRSLYRAGALMAVARELARYKLDLVGVQEVRWEKEGTVKAGDYSFFLRERK